nr:phosphoglucosamine mutase [Chloroflexota bacterium]
MPRLFGTDGIRGVANVDLKPPLAYALGRATAHRLVGPGGAIVVGQDTRRSGDMFAAAITAGATSLGVDVHQVGIVPTPALAFLAGGGGFSAGIMVSASHNPADDNGLKVLDEHGLKLDDSVEDELEQLIWRSDELGGARNADLGRAVDAGELLGRYVEHRLGLARTVEAAGLRLVLDCANGSGCAVGPVILEATGAAIEVIHAEPDGININVHSGATDPASLAADVLARGADVGFALDGDADRLIAVDAGGCIVDGDQVLGILALDRLERGVLPNGS